MKQCTSRACILKDSRFPGSEMLDSWTYEDFMSRPDVVENCISFTSVLYYPETDTVYCGLTTLGNDLLYKLDRSAGTFTSLGYKAMANSYDAKIHRALVRGNDGVLYAGTGVLHDVDRYAEFPGGSILRYDPATDKLDRLCRPVAHSPVQSITIDNARNVIYGVSFMPEILFRYDIETDAAETLTMVSPGHMMAGPHRPAVDGDGNLWATWGCCYGGSHVNLLRYDPCAGSIKWFEHGPARADKNDTGYVDCMTTVDDGSIYIGSAAGLSRLDPETGSVSLLGKPYDGNRLAGVVQGPDGKVYGVGGKNGQFTVFSFDPATETFTDYGQICDTALDTTPHIVHDITITNDMTIYAGEIDNIDRSSYLWECKL